MSRQDADNLEEQLQAAKRRIRELEIELQSLHTRLHQITTSRTWAVVAFFQRVRYWLWSGPADQRRQKAREFAKRVLRKVGLYRLAAVGLAAGAAGQTASVAADSPPSPPSRNRRPKFSPATTRAATT